MCHLYYCFPSTDSISSLYVVHNFFFTFNIQLSVIQSAPQITAGMNNIMRMVYLELALFQSCFTDGTFYTRLLIGRMQEALFEYPPRLITLQDFCALVAFLSLWPSAEILMSACAHHPGPQPNFFTMFMFMSLATRTNFFMM